MGVQLHKASHLVFFVIVLPVLSAVVAWLCSRGIASVVPNDWAFLVDSLGVLSAFGLLYKAFDLWAWRFRVFRLLRVVEVPNLSGRWLGQIKSSHDASGLDHEAAMEIRQSFSRVNVVMYFKDSRSVSVVAGFAEEPNGQLALHYEYQNVPVIDAAPSMHIHYGTAKLECVPEQARIHGYYYNWGRDERGHVGTMDFSFEGRKLLHRLS